MISKRKQKVQFFSVIATFFMVFSLVTPAFAGAESNKKPHRSAHDAKLTVQDKMNDRLLSEFDEEEQVTFLVKFTDKADVKKVAKEAGEQASLSNLSGQQVQLLKRSAILSELKATSFESHKNVAAFLDEQMEAGKVSDYHSYNIVNGMSVTSTKEVAEKISTFEEVEKLLKNETRELHTTTKTDEKAPKSDVEDVEWNVERINAPDAWNMGIDGTGTVVASLDTGVQWDHPGLKEKYRGFDQATGDVDHEYSFYDATAAGQAEPYDDNGHGTHVTGTMVGSEPDGSNQVGVAPGADWIAAKVFNAAGSTTDAVLLDAADWMLEPGGRIDLAPDVVNNSWGGGPGLDEWYLDAVENWREYGIFPEFSAGNTTLTNPGGPGSVAVPANYPVSFATGATDSNDMIADFSLRGPSPYDEIKPDISAPGVNIRSTVPGSGYEGGWNGTSMSGPAVAAVAAMLRQVNANITVDEMEEILKSTATPRTDGEYSESPNHGYGYGIVNAHDAVASILDGLGTIEGQVTKDGDDDVAPEFSHDPLAETYVTMDLNLSIEASDNVSVTSVEVDYQVDGSDVKTVEANRVSGDFTDGVYEAVIPGEDINGDTLTYKVTVNDFGNNEVVSDEYSVEIKDGISPGYSEDFATNPGWNSFGDENSWEWGEPTSGPEEANSGDHVYATNLSGQYENSMDATLTLPPVTVPEGETYLQLDHWYDLEIFSSGSAYDFGYVVVSTDMENWTKLSTYKGLSDGWESTEVDLSDYSGQTIFVGFKATSDFSGTYDGWYIDQVSLTDESTEESSDVHLGVMGNKYGDTISVPSIAPSKPDKQEKEKIKEKEKEKKKEEKKQKEIEKEKKKEQKKDKKKDEKKEKEEVIVPVDLPLGATVNVLETNRSVSTDPADGTYALMHPTGDFTVEASAYGFESGQQSVTIEDGETATANFTLDELTQGDINGTVTDENSGEAIAEAKVLLVEDANVEPVETDTDGNFSMTAYEGTYTLKIMARDYHSEEIEVTVEEGTVEVNVALEPYYTYPGGEIGYDDGSAENARAFYDAGNGWGVKMSLPEGKESAIVTDGVFKFWDDEFPDPGGVDFQVEVWDATGSGGTPGEKLAGPVDAEAIRDQNEWTVVDLAEHNIVVDGDFYMVYIQSAVSDLAPGMATDESSPNADRSYQYVGGAWSQSPADEGNYMIRSRVSYEVEAPVITSPESGITNEEDVTIEGTASPTTTAQLMNNGEEVENAEVDEEGQFSIPTTLTEGENEFTVISLLNGSSVGESEAVSITLDTIAPELTIENPKQGDKTNRETVTVEGTVSDENLDYVEVNGQKADVEDGNYSKRVLLDNGENVIEVMAIDLAGNSTTESVTIDVKYDGPEISNVTPDEDIHLQTGKSVKIEFESEPGLRATFVVHMPLTDVNSVQSNPTELPMMEMEDGTYVGYWTVPNKAYADGAQIEVKARDSYDNVSTELAEGKLFINLEE